MNAARLRWSLDKGLPQLAHTIYEIDKENLDWAKATPFQDQQTAIFHITNVLHSISRESLLTIIEGRLHEHIATKSDTCLRLPKDKRLALPGPGTDQE